MFIVCMLQIDSTSRPSVDDRRCWIILLRIRYNRGGVTWVVVDECFGLWIIVRVGFNEICWFISTFVDECIFAKYKISRNFDCICFWMIDAIDASWFVAYTIGSRQSTWIAGVRTPNCVLSRSSSQRASGPSQWAALSVQCFTWLEKYVSWTADCSSNYFPSSQQ